MPKDGVKPWKTSEIAMYTVFRIYFGSQGDGAIERIAQRINAAIANAEAGPDRDPVRLSFVLSSSGVWSQHLDEIEENIIKLLPLMASDACAISSKEIDILIEHEDWGQGAYDEYAIETRLLKLMGLNDIDLTVTISRP